uniref:DEP domain-containing protein n=1 Tax=Plectus sambesii TaxID=2011161 RepID=A0A914UZD1_9BILA
MSADYDVSQFGSTALWREMQSSFRELIIQERGKGTSSRSRKTSEKMEFSGAAAVDVLFTFLKNNENRFGGKEVTKTNAVKLLNIWLRERFIVPACSSSCPDEFDASKRTYYTFESDENENALSFSSPAPMRHSRTAASPFTPSLDLVQRSSTLRSLKSFLPKSPRIIPKSPHYRLIERERNESLRSSMSVDSEAALMNIGEEELTACDDLTLHEAALCLLLSLIEVPVLDEILAHRQTAQFLTSHDKSNMSTLAGLLTFVGFGASTEPATFENDDVARRHLAENLVTRPLSNFFWACLACVPDTKLIDGICRDPTGDIDRERAHLATAVFEQVKERYSHMTKRGKHSLFPADYEVLLSAVCDQLLNDPSKEDRVTEAVHYLVLLLPAHSRLALSRLLYLLTSLKGTELFFKLAANPDNCFEAATQMMAFVMPSTVHSSKAFRLLLRLVDFESDLFVWPDKLRVDIAKRLFQRKYTVATPEPALRYCEPLTGENVTDAQRREEEMLVTLMNQIIDDTKMTLDEKKHKIALFEKTYPAIFVTHFRNLNW